MSTEFSFYPCMEENGIYKICGGIVLFEADGSLFYQAPYFTYDDAFHLDTVEKQLVDPSEKIVFNMDAPIYFEPLLYVDEPDGLRHWKKCFYISEEWIDKTANHVLKRGFMTKEDAQDFIESDYSMWMLDSGDVKFVDESVYAHIVNALDEPYVGISYIDKRSNEHTCCELQVMLREYYLADGFIVVID